TKLGYTFKDNPTLVAYLLTLVAATMPVAVTSALVYRMGRLFELRRPWRMVLALSVVTGSGLIAYATVINSHAPAAALVVSAVACLVHVAGSKNPARNGGWIALAGLCAALAAAIEPAALVFVVLLAVCVPCMRWRPSLRVGALLLYLIGCTPPIVMHAALNVPITGDLRPGVMHPDLWTPHHPSYARGTRVVERVGATGDGAELPAALSELDDLYEDGVSDSVWLLVGRAVNRVLVALFGPHGILSHFPVLILGLLGIAAVMHRHWPVTTKALATATFVGALAVVFLFAWFWTDWQEPMFGARWFVLFLPLLLFWSGAWLRKSHHPVSWGLAIAALAFSSAVALIGATYPFPREGFPGYTAAGALKQLIVKPQAPDVREALARTPVRERGGLEGFGGDPRHGR
ncbi:MAG: hypothetical protein ACREIT_11425, partial [Tepidisphaeraceae bacterium]